eukprot:TRINITY_DN4135_c0_g1_i4.p1 TRINITY_DN4135_c0_g1~~TRINITY_DN4135_c0_g1_i4.p1  ORF type:complete len:261 (+),score=37.84 TRINITY_DN4135_c0_g1_i4:55-783(+)
MENNDKITMGGPTLASIIRSNPQFGNFGLAKSSVAALFLGITFSFGVGCVITDNLRQFGFYIVFLSVFHYLEFFMTALFHPETLTYHSYLLNHSRDYHYALAAGFIEYWLEYFLVPSIKNRVFLMSLGVLMCVVGQFFRTGAMYAAGSNFTHMVATEKKETHRLVTNSFYSFVRHPSYFGWFWWSIGTQVLLCNPLCTLAYAYVSWKFFNARIREEEEYLVQFFGNQYVEYRQKVGTGIPLI